MQLPDSDIGCHRTGFAKKCRALVAKGTCNRWRPSPGIEGKDSTGKPIPEHDCTDNWLLLAQMVGNQQMNQLGAAIETLRNESVKSAATQTAATEAVAQAQAQATEVYVQSARAMLAVAAQTAQIAQRVEAAQSGLPNGSTAPQITHQPQ